jgi:chemotaxis protein methyltransferase CheR
MELSRHEFDLLRDYIYKICGLVIADNKQYLIRQRLEPLALTIGCHNFSEFYRKITENSLPPQAKNRFQEQIINAITTNETSFFRDGHPFSAFKEYILPNLNELVCDRKRRLQSRKGPKVRLWSAGSSTGQEAYSLVMLIKEYAEETDKKNQLSRIPSSMEDFVILATDISTEMLARAMAGEYNDTEMKRGLNPERVNAYFKKHGNRWIVSSAIRSMVEFRQINLIRPFTMLGGFDVIFCRNVLIYFDIETKSRIIEQFSAMLSDKGFLVLGATENVYGITDRFDSVHHGETLFYQKRKA